MNTAGKSAESRENGQRQKACVCDVGYFPESIVTKEATRMGRFGFCLVPTV